MNEDRRYQLKRWRTLRLAILNRDMWQCRVSPGCTRPAEVVDHIEPVYIGMPDALFFDPRNLRASCKRHNLTRGMAARFVRETDGQDVVTANYTRTGDAA